MSELRGTIFFRQIAMFNSRFYDFHKFSSFFRFDQGRKLSMKIDNYEPQIYDFSDSLKASADAQFNTITSLYIGKNETMREGFVGCISRVEFDEIIPLKLLFQEDPLSNINVSA